jgi:hypothetical protein
LNQYAYVGNNPANVTDPSGMDWGDGGDFGGLGGGGFGCDWCEGGSTGWGVPSLPGWSGSPLPGSSQGPDLSSVIIDNYDGGSACDPSAPNCNGRWDCPDEGGPCALQNMGASSAGDPPYPAPNGPDGTPAPPPIPAPPGTKWTPFPGTGPWGGMRWLPRPRATQPGGGEPQVWWDPHDAWWTHTPGTEGGGGRTHWDPQGNPISNIQLPSAQSMQQATRVGTAGTAVIMGIMLGLSWAGI